MPKAQPQAGENSWSEPLRSRIEAKPPSLGPDPPIKARDMGELMDARLESAGGPSSLPKRNGPGSNRDSFSAIAARSSLSRRRGADVQLACDGEVREPA